MCTQSHESVFQKVRGHSLVFRSLSVTGRGASLCSNSLYHCSKGSFTHEPLHEVAIKLPTMSSRYGWLFIIFYCLAQHVIQGQNVDNTCWMESNVMDPHFRGWKTQQKSTFVVLIVDYRMCWRCTLAWVTDAERCWGGHAQVSIDKNAAWIGTFTEGIFAGPKKVEAALSNIARDKSKIIREDQTK